MNHLAMIQGVINRMAQNPFTLKGWSMTLVVAIFVLGAATEKLATTLLAVFPAIAFGGLDVRGSYSPC